LKRRLRKESLLFWLVCGALLATGELLVRAQVLSPAVYAAPSEIALAGVRCLSSQLFLRDVLATTGRVMLGVMLGFPVGILLAFGLSALGQARSSGEMLLDFVRSIPITALIPLFMAINGIGEGTKVGVSAFSALLVSTITVWVSIKQSAERFGVLAHLYKLRGLKWLLLVIAPQSLPAIITALRLAISSSLVLVVVVEMFIGSRDGIGKFISDMTYGDDRAAQYAAIVCTGLLGYILNVLCESLRKYIVRKYDIVNIVSAV
jgi:ABC-type nitrate/sulfonate/bicarbonate transport system permease component